MKQSVGRKDCGTKAQGRRKQCTRNTEKTKHNTMLKALNKLIEASWIQYPKKGFLTLIFLSFHSPSVTWSQCAVKINVIDVCRVFSNTAMIATESS